MLSSRPVRVAHLIYGLKLGGLEQMVVELAARARDHGVEPVIIAWGEQGPVPDIAARRNLPLEWLGDIRGLSFPMLKALRATLEDFGADVIHAHDVGPWLNASVVRAARPRSRVMATFHQVLQPKGAKRALATAAALASEALIACGTEVRADLLSWTPPRSRVTTIGNGIPIPATLTEEARAVARSRLELRPGDVALGYLGRMHEEKGPDRVLEAFLARFKARPDVHLFLIGTGPLDAELRARSQGQANVHLLGEVAHGAAELLQGLDVYVQGSRREGRSLSMLEAMAAALPTVAHALPAIQEIHSSATAILVPLGDLEAFAGALQQLVDDAPRRQRMGQAAREAVLPFSVDSMVKAYVDLYRGHEAVRT